MEESLSYDFANVTPHSAKIALRWERIRIPFTVDIGDVTGRMMAQIREAVKNRKADDRAPLNQGANYVLLLK